MSNGVIQGTFLGGRPVVCTHAAPPATTVQRAGPPAPAHGTQPRTAQPRLGQPRGPGGAAARQPGPPAPAFTAQPRSAQPQVQPHTAQPQAPGGAVAVDAALLRATRPGRPLPDAVQQKMQHAFGADFSGVRVHEGPQAEQIGAIAFTVGSDIYFAPGRFQPHTAAGQQLLGHELAPVLQQRAGRVRNPLGAGLAVVQDRALEAEADRMGHRASACCMEADLRTIVHTAQPFLPVQTQVAACAGHNNFRLIAGISGRHVVTTSRANLFSDKSECIAKWSLCNAMAPILEPAIRGRAIQRKLEDWEIRDLDGHALILINKPEDRRRVKAMILNGGEAELKYQDIFYLISGLTNLKKKNKDSVESFVAKLARSRDKQFLQIYAEIKNAWEALPRAWCSHIDPTTGQQSILPTNVISNAKANVNYDLGNGQMVTIDPVCEADTLFYSGDTIYLEEVKSTPQAFFDKLVNSEDQSQRMIFWKNKARNRVVAVRIATEENFDMLFDAERYPRYQCLRNVIDKLLKEMQITVGGKPIQELLSSSAAFSSFSSSPSFQQYPKYSGTGPRPSKRPCHRV